MTIRNYDYNKRVHFVVALCIVFWIGFSCADMKLISVDYEIFGRVQGVFFRKYTVEQAKLLGLKGTCMNTERRTVVGTLQGERDKIQEMKQWLTYTGSPHSKIERAEFRNEKEIEQYTLHGFKVLH